MDMRAQDDLQSITRCVQNIPECLILTYFSQSEKVKKHKGC
jgi:hypothetical protein